MSTVNNITKALNGQKLELSSQVIELGVVDDIKKSLTDGNALISDLGVELNKLKDADKAIELARTNADKVAVASDKVASKGSAFQTKIGTVLDKADKAAKDLGINPSSIASYSELDKMYDQIEIAYKAVKLYVFTNE